MQEFTRDSRAERRHITVEGADASALGSSRGEQLADILPETYARYAELFRQVGISEDRESEGAARALDAVEAWKPHKADELNAIARASQVPLLAIVTLNARTEILAGAAATTARECSTIAGVVAGRRLGVQTWDWHVELDAFWHTQEVSGPGFSYIGLTEAGIVSKVGVNEAGLALHFNILGHRNDGVGGVPMHVLSSIVLEECASVDEAIELIATAPVRSSSAFTLIDPTRAVSLEMSPVGRYALTEQYGFVARTNHFIDHALAADEKHWLYEPDSSERRALIIERLAASPPSSADALVETLVSGSGEAPLCCIPDMEKPFGERWATLSTIVTDPAARSMRVLDGMPTDAATLAWRELGPLRS